MVALWQFLLVLISLPSALGSTQLLGKSCSVGQLKAMARTDSAKLKDLFMSSLLTLGVQEQFLLQTL